MKIITGYPTLCNSCAAQISRVAELKQHGSPDSNTCQSCGTVYESPELCVYFVSQKEER